MISRIASSLVPSAFALTTASAMYASNGLATAVTPLMPRKTFGVEIQVHSLDVVTYVPLATASSTQVFDIES